MGTAWSARCQEGCAAGSAWLGVTWEGPSERVRCVRLRQSQVSCCGSPNVRLEVWDGSDWQSMQVWNTVNMEYSITTNALELLVPITCDLKKPEGSGVVHNCDGLPVVGLQDGDTCEGSCAAGFYGESSPFVCR